MFSEDRRIFKNQTYTFTKSIKNRTEIGRKLCGSAERAGKPYCSSVGKRRMEAHFLNYLCCQDSSEWQGEWEAGSAIVAYSCINITKWTCFPLSPLVSTTVPHNACCYPGESAIIPMHLGVKGVIGSGKAALLPSLLDLFYTGDNPSLRLPLSSSIQFCISGM